MMYVQTERNKTTNTILRIYGIEMFTAGNWYREHNFKHKRFKLYKINIYVKGISKVDKYPESSKTVLWLLGNWRNLLEERNKMSMRYKFTSRSELCCSCKQAHMNLLPTLWAKITLSNIIHTKCRCDVLHLSPLFNFRPLVLPLRP